MTKRAKTLPAIDLLLPGAKIIKDNLPVFFLLLVVPMLLSTQTGTPPVLSEDASTVDMLRALQDTVNPLVMAGSLLSFVLYPFLTFAFRQTARTGSATLSEVLRGGMRQYWQLLGVLILMVLLIVGGFLLFIIPGFIALRSFILAPFYLIDGKGKLGVVDALKKSAAASKQYKWSIYGVIGLIVMFGLFSSFGPIGQIAGTILSVLYAPAFALRYQEIK